MSNGGITGLIVAKVICCGALILLAGTGALVGLGGWLSNNAWLVTAAVGLGIAALVFTCDPMRQRTRLTPLPTPANNLLDN